MVFCHNSLPAEKKDGALFSAGISGRLVVYRGHEYSMTIERDATENRQTEALQRAEQRETAGNLISGLTHELKNSLAGVEAAIEVLLKELVISDDHRSILLRMGQEIRQAEFLMKDFLDFAKPSSPQFSLVNINSILDKALDFPVENLSRPQEKQEAINIIKNFDADLAETMADSAQLQKVFMNLLINSVDSMPDGGSLTVETSYKPDRKSIEISISDTGTGIRSEYIDKIFEPFFTTKANRTGLGLAICRRLIEQNNGEISADNNPNGGAIFRINLSLKRPEEGTRYGIGI